MRLQGLYRVCSSTALSLDVARAAAPRWLKLARGARWGKGIGRAKTLSSQGLAELAGAWALGLTRGARRGRGY